MTETTDPTDPASRLQRAIEVAVEAHATQTDKAGLPYILHPLRVMERCAGMEAKTVAVLHDVVEDSPAWTLDRLREEGFGERVLAGIDAVTRRDGEDYYTFCRRAARHPLGREVKRADLEDNMDIRRLGPELSETDLRRLRRYRTAYAIVTSASR